ncbi:MAG: addiction module protein [Luteolibacter sp.]|uniref:addiction module protein n=1 Tax=Luteolibacter sp. TaxID=1962973 RepID=UPI0032640B85
MSTKELVAEAIALPLSERVYMAQALWQSIDSNLSDSPEQDSLRDAIRRDGELESGVVVGRTHEEVMQAARKAIGCG